MGKLGAEPHQSKRHKGSRVYDSVERRADFIIGVWGKRPSIGYAEVLELVRKEFKVGIVAAQQAHARAKERMAVFRDEKDTAAFDLIAAGHLADRERALSVGDLTNARKSLDSLAKLTGASAATKIEIVNTVRPEGQLDDLSDEELEIAAKLDRMKPH